MATRLASVFEKEDEETVTETKCSIEDDSIEEENLVAIRKAKRVRFSPESENEIFEFTRSVKKLQRKNVKKRSHGTAKDLWQGRNVEPRRSKRTVSTEITVGCSSSDATKAHKIPRRSKRIGSSGITQEEHEETYLIGLEQFEDKDIQDGLVFEKVGRRSTRLAAKTNNSCVDGGTLKSRTLLAAKESKEERTTQSFETKTAEPVMISENVLDSTLKVSVDVSVVRNVQELNSEFMEEGSEEKQEQDTVMMTATKNDKEVASSLSEFLIERPEVNSPESELFVETTQASSSVQLAMSNSESELGVHTEHVLVKDIAEENIETDVLENSAECWNESLPSKDDKRGFLDKEKQSVNQHGNFSGYITDNFSAEEQGDIYKVGRVSAGHCVSRETLDEVNDDSQTKSVPTISSERGCKPNAVELGESLSTDFASLSPKEEKFSVCLEEDKSLMLIEQLRESGKISAADIVTQHSYKAVDGVGKEEENTATDFPDESDVHNTSQSEAINGGVSIVVEFHDVPDIAASPLRQSSVGSKATELDEESVVELQVECGLFTDAEKHLLLETDEGMKRIGSSGNTQEEHEETDLIGLEQFEHKDIQDGLQFEKVGRRSTLKSGTLLPAKESKEERTMQSSETKTAEPIMVFENVLDSTPEVSVDVSLVRNAQELMSEFMEEGCEEKQVQGTIMITAVLKNSAECWNESHPSKDDERDSLEKEKQSANQHGNFSEYNTENSSAKEQGDICTVGRISAVHCVSRETLDEVNDDSQTQFVPTIYSERGCKPDVLELDGSYVSECLEEDEMKAVSQSIPINKAAGNALERSFVFTTPEKNLLLMEQLSESGKISEADIVTQHNDEVVESHAVVFTTPEQVLLLGDSGLDEVGKEGEHTATDFPDESDVHNTSQSEAINGGESIVVELHDESDIAASPLRQSSVGDFKGDGIKQNEENRMVEIHCESGTCTSPNIHAISDGPENSGGSKAMELYEESDVFTGLEERNEIFEYSGQCTAREGEVKKAAQFDEEAGSSTGMHKDSSDKSDLCMSMERRLLYGDSEQKKTVKTAEEAAAEFHDESAVPNMSARHPFPEESELEEAEKSEENKAMELQVDCDLFTIAEKHLLLETDEGIKGGNRVAKSHDMSDILTASESHSLIGDFEPNEAENKDVELLSDSNISTNLERHLLSGDCGQGGTREIKDSTAASCLESFVFSSPDRLHHLGNSEPHTAGKEVEFKDESAFFTRLESHLLLGESGQDRLGYSKSGSSQYQIHHASSPKVILKDDNMVWGSHISARDLGENTIVGGATPGAEFKPKSSQAENVADLDATQGTSKQSRGNSPHVDSVNLFDFDIEMADTIMDAERTASFSSYVLALPSKGNSETIGEFTSPLKVAGTSTLMSEESRPSTNIQNQINDELMEKLAVTDSNEIDELIESNNTQRDHKGNLMLLHYSGGSSVSGKKYILGGTEDEHLGCSSQEDLGNTCEKSGHRILDEATDPIATAFEKNISLTPNEFTVQDNINKEEGDSETTGEISSHLEVGGTCSIVSDDNEAGELTKAKSMKNVDSSFPGMACFLAGFTKDEATDPIATVFEKDISLTPDGFLNNKNEEDEEKVWREATPSPEENLNESSENMESVNIGESGTLSGKKQVRREPILIYRTQVKPKRHEDKKENAPNSKIVDNLNVTAPRKSRRQPLQDLRKN